VLAGGLAQRVFHGGHDWVFLQYLLGFRRLGWRVTFLDQLSPELVHESDGTLQAHRLAFARLLRDWDLGADVYLAGDGATSVGLTRSQAIERVRRADLIVNVMGFLTDAELLGAARRRLFLDIDPGFGQMWRELGQADVLEGHDVYVTIGGNMGAAGCALPSCGVEWLTMKPPVVLDQWPVVSGGRAFTSVATWRGPFDAIEYAGERYGLRVHEFRRFVDLPRRSDPAFELVLDIDPADDADRRCLTRAGWSLVDPATVADPGAYRSYIQRSRAELCVAKGMYVATRSGWISDRSVCYLASGKPVLAQETGFTRLLPAGEGLLAFTDLDGAVAGVEEIERDYERHARAARAIAERHFDSDRVLGDLLARLELA
jgi:hypothetical protein